MPTGKSSPGFDSVRCGACLPEFEGEAGDGWAGDHVGDEVAAVGEHGLQHLPEHGLLVEA